jgi:hypothetical protein
MLAERLSAHYVNLTELAISENFISGKEQEKRLLDCESAKNEE